MDGPSMRLRSSVSTEERNKIQQAKEKEHLEKLNRPFLGFRGKIKYFTEFINCAMICDDLLKSVENSADTFVIGFDIEWPFSFQTGPGKASVIQICVNVDICYVLHISCLRNLPKGLNELLSHPKTRLTGVNIKNDIRKLSRDFPGFNAEKIIDNCIDSGVLANTILPFQQRWSMEKLVGYLLKMKIDKNKKVRMSKWHISPLSKDQIRYAAIDAYASLLLYHDLKKRAENDTNLL